MPIYVYQCQACRETLERRQSFSDEPLTTCETCGGDLRRLLSAPAIVFKGSGFYNTDYRGNGAVKSAEAPAGESSSADGSSGSDATDSAKGGSDKRESAKTESGSAKSEPSPAAANSSKAD